MSRRLVRQCTLPAAASTFLDACSTTACTTRTTTGCGGAGARCGCVTTARAGSSPSRGRCLSGPIKSREEIETTVGDPDVAERVVTSLGYHRRFRAQKYREEYRVGDAHVAVDETPMGVFVEIEATPETIDGVASALGRSPADYRLESYPALWAAWCRAHGRAFGDMLFDPPVHP